MFPLLESIAVKDGKILNLDLHEERYFRSYYAYYGKMPQRKLIEKNSMKLPHSGYFKLRIAYNADEKQLTCLPYEIKTIKSLKLIEDNTIDYHLKYTDRTPINQLLAQRADCDDILIIKKGLVSDTSAGNILFLKDKQWYTPDSPLLEGTQRTKLLSRGIIGAKTIKREAIRDFEEFQVINALRPFDRNVTTSIENII